MVASHQREPGLLGTVSVVINGAIDTSLCGPLPVVVTKAARSLGWATMNEVLAGLRAVGFALRRVFFAMVTSYLNNGVTPERVSTSSCGEGRLHLTSLWRNSRTTRPYKKTSVTPPGLCSPRK
jgi:hypothetical protein